jgi:coniferyl-aldehyde dehydrogenase
VVNDRQYQRLTSWLQDAEAKGAILLPLNPADEALPAERRKLPLTLVLNPTEDMTVMQDELFGPILPLVEVDNIEAAIRYVNDHPRPLALYYFDRDKSRARELLGRTVAGDVTVNDTMLHIVQEELPFGGVGPAGMGAYHGKRGFDTFSHLKGVFWQSRLNAAGLMSPPYGKRLDQLLSVLMS